MGFHVAIYYPWLPKGLIKEKYIFFNKSMDGYQIAWKHY